MAKAEELQTQLDAALAENKVLSTTNASLVAEKITDQGTIEKLNAENIQLKSTGDALATSNEDLKAINKSLTAEIEQLTGTAEAPAVKPADIKALTFTHAGKKHGFNWGKAFLNGLEITAEMVTTDKKLQEHLVKIGSGMIKQL